MQRSTAFAKAVLDDALQARSAISTAALRVYGLLGEYVQTPEGESMLGTYEPMRARMRNPRKGNARDAKKTDGAATPVAAAPPTVAPIARAKGGATSG